jgi:eukaryotic-like serine/threonine-protein kinase
VGDLRIVEFGLFQLDIRSGELRKAGIKLKLHAQPFQILAMLLEQPGEVVSREEIRQRLWPEDTFVDFDHGLNNAVNRLREVLGDSADSPRWIQTLPRRGYRFIGGVNGRNFAAPDIFAETHHSELKSLDGVSDVASKQTLEMPKSRWKLRLLWAASFAVLATLLIVFELQNHPIVPSSRSFVLAPDGSTFSLVGDAGGPPVLSADGTRLAFVAVNNKGSSQVWVRPLGKLLAEPLIGTEGAVFPFWSPDGRWIGFFADGKLMKISADGGSAVILCGAPSGRGGSWSRDGVIIFAPSTHSGIYKVLDSGGTPTQITTVDTSIHTTHRWPKFLPDGSHFIYMAASHFRDASHNGVYRSAVDGKGNELLIATDADATYASGYLFFLRKNKLMAQPFDAQRGQLNGTPRPTVERVLFDPSIWKAVFDASETGAMVYQLGDTVTGTQLAWFDRSGKNLGPIGEPGFQFEPRLSPDGRKLAAGIADGGYSHLGVYELARGTRIQVTFGKYDNGSAVWTADGTQLLFAGKRQHYGIYQVDSNGAAPERLILDTGVDAWPVDLSPNGRFLLFGQGIAIGRAQSQLWVYPMNGKSSPHRLLAGDALESDGQFSPDGHWVAYASNQSGRNEVYLVALHLPTDSDQKAIPVSNSKVQISFSGGRLPRWRHDGKELFYVAGDNTLTAVPITISESGLSTGAPHSLFHISPNSTGFSYQVSPEGARFIITTLAAERDAYITLVENWLSDFRK